MIGASPGPALTAMLAKAGGNPLWAAAMVRSLADEGMLRRDGDAVEVTTSELPASLSDLVVRRLRDLPRPRWSCCRSRPCSAMPCRFAMWPPSPAGRRPRSSGQLSHAFDAQLLDEADERVVFRHQLVHDAIYQQMPRRLAAFCTARPRSR